MAKNKSTKKAQATKKTQASKKTSTIPLPPAIYINDASLSDGTPDYALALLKLLPNYAYETVSDAFNTQAAVNHLERTKTAKAVACFIDPRVDGSLAEAAKHANIIKQACVKHGRNFVSINIYNSSVFPDGLAKEKSLFAANHLDHAVKDYTSPASAAKEILKWLFKTLAPIETIYLIPDAEMKAIDTKNFSDYAYCPLDETHLRGKDEKVQFVAVITSKAVVAPEGKKLTWSVADKSGVANFYFVHRGTSSQYTWDWVMALQPGQRVALPRMPSVLVTEPLGKRAAKAPFRAVGYTLLVPATALILAGKGIKAVGKKACMGKASKWVARDDAIVDGKGKVRERKAGEAPQVKGNTQPEWEKVLQDSEEDTAPWRVFDEKGMMRWDCVDEDAKTEKGSVHGSDKEASLA